MDETMPYGRSNRGRSRGKRKFRSPKGSGHVLSEKRKYEIEAMAGRGGVRPKELRGKEIGLYYAARNRKVNVSNRILVHIPNNEMDRLESELEYLTSDEISTHTIVVVDQLKKNLAANELRDLKVSIDSEKPRICQAAGNSSEINRL